MYVLKYCFYNLKSFKISFFLIYKCDVLLSPVFFQRIFIFNIVEDTRKWVSGRSAGRKHS